MNEARYKKLLSVADRKKMLVAQGALFRSEIIEAKEVARTSLHPEALAKSAVHRLGRAALVAFAGRAAPGIAGIDWQTVLPLVIGGVSAVAKKTGRKSLMRGVLVLGAAGAIASLVLRRKNASRADTDDVR